MKKRKLANATGKNEHQDKLSNKHHCYVLITCDEPDEKGHMNVNMTYEGEASLASYLVRGADEYFDEYMNTE